MDLTPSALAALFTAFSFQYQSGYDQADIFWEKLATLVPSSTETETYAWMDKIPVMRKWLGARVVQNVAARARVLTNDDYELTLEIPKRKIQDDSYGLYSPIATMMGNQAAKWPDRVVAAKLAENPLCFDGKAFFATDHPINMDNAGAGTYSNLTAAAFPLNLTNYGVAKKNMRGFKGADGEYIGARGTLLVVPPSLEETAKNILNSTFYPKLADGAALGVGDVAMVENQWKGSADLVVIDELEAAATTWYLLDTSKGIKPLLFQLRQAPEFTYLTSPTDQNVFWHKQFVMGVEARGAADVTLPFLAYKGVG